VNSSEKVLASVGSKFGIDIEPYNDLVFDWIVDFLGELEITLPQHVIIEPHEIIDYRINTLENIKYIHCVYLNGKAIQSIGSRGAVEWFNYYNNKKCDTSKYSEHFYEYALEVAKQKEAICSSKDVVSGSVCETDGTKLYDDCDWREELTESLTAAVKNRDAFHTLLYDDETNERLWWMNEQDISIKTNFTDKVVLVQYTKNYITENNLPAIINPDKNRKLINALEYYILRNLIFRGVKYEVMNVGDIIRMYDKAKLVAENEERKMTIDQMNHFVASWTDISQQYYRDSFYSNR
jgi:hypothetical protein